MNQFSIPESMTFQEAIALTQSLLKQIEAGTLSPSEIQSAVTNLVQSQNGARGFFVTYLNSNLADSPSPVILSALQSSPNTISELLVKNVAMSAAMEITHLRNQKEEMAQGSKQVCQRSMNLIQQLQLAEIQATARQLHHSAVTGEGDYTEFLQRWGYDSEQRQVISEALSSIIAQN